MTSARSVIRSTGGGPPPQLARQLLRPAGAGERDDDVAGRGAAHEVVEPLAVGVVELEQPQKPGSAVSATSSLSSPSRPAGTKTAPPPERARSETAGAVPGGGARTYASVRLIAASRPA